MNLGVNSLLRSESDMAYCLNDGSDHERLAFNVKYSLSSFRNFLCGLCGRRCSPVLNEKVFLHYVLNWRLISCRVPCDHVPARSWPLFIARNLMRGVMESFEREKRQWAKFIHKRALRPEHVPRFIPLQTLRPSWPCTTTPRSPPCASGGPGKTCKTGHIALTRSIRPSPLARKHWWSSYDACCCCC